MQFLVIRFVPDFATQVKVFPLGSINMWLYPLFQDELHAVSSHLFAFDVNHGRSLNLRLRGEVSADKVGVRDARALK